MSRIDRASLRALEGVTEIVTDGALAWGRRPGGEIGQVELGPLYAGYLGPGWGREISVPWYLPAAQLRERLAAEGILQALEAIAPVRVQGRLAPRITSDDPQGD